MQGRSLHRHTAFLQKMTASYTTNRLTVSLGPPMIPHLPSPAGTEYFLFPNVRRPGARGPSKGTTSSSKAPPFGLSYLTRDENINMSGRGLPDPSHATVISGEENSSLRHQKRQPAQASKHAACKHSGLRPILPRTWRLPIT